MVEKELLPGAVATHKKTASQGCRGRDHRPHCGAQPRALPGRAPNGRGSRALALAPCSPGRAAMRRKETGSGGNGHRPTCLERGNRLTQRRQSPRARARGSRRSAALDRLAPPKREPASVRAARNASGGLEVWRLARQSWSAAEGPSEERAPKRRPRPPRATRFPLQREGAGPSSNRWMRWRTRTGTGSQWKPQRRSLRTLCVRHEPMSGAEFTDPKLSGSCHAARTPRRVRGGSGPRRGA